MSVHQKNTRAALLGSQAGSTAPRPHSPACTCAHSNQRSRQLVRITRQELPAMTKAVHDALDKVRHAARRHQCYIIVRSQRC